MSYSNPLVQCPRCELGGMIGCTCCGGEGLLPLYDLEDFLEAEALELEEAMMEDESIVDLMDEMLGLREESYAW